MMRRYDIDSLRVIAFLLLIPYHVGMFFVPWDFHLKNPIIYPNLIYPMLFVNQWRLPLLFVISGIGTYFALSKRSGWAYAKERIKRLFIPLVFGMLVIVPPQVYFERLAKGQFKGGYFDFWPSQAFIGAYPEGNMSWHHLWFLIYLLLFSLLLIPLFLYMRKNPESGIIRIMKSIGSKKYGLFILVLPLFVWQTFLEPLFPSTHALVGDWFNLINYCTYFFYGFLLISIGDVFWNAVVKNRLGYLLCGIFGFALLMSLWYLIGNFAGKMYVASLVRVVNAWAWILTLFGFAAVYLNRPSRVLSYANQAVYPFYILHQTVIIALGYYLMYADMGLLPKFSIMAVGTFLITWFIYEFGIRRYALIRLLFGLKKIKV
jgi:hypothetical protein